MRQDAALGYYEMYTNPAVLHYVFATNEITVERITRISYNFEGADGQTLAHPATVTWAAWKTAGVHHAVLGFLCVIVCFVFSQKSNNYR